MVHSGRVMILMVDDWSMVNEFPTILVSLTALPRFMATQPASNHPRDLCRLEKTGPCPAFAAMAASFFTRLRRERLGRCVRLGHGLLLQNHEEDQQLLCFKDSALFSFLASVALRILIFSAERRLCCFTAISWRALLGASATPEPVLRTLRQRVDE